MRASAFVIVLFAFVLCAGSAFALSAQNHTFGDVAVYRIYPESANIGQRAWVTIAVANNGASARDITITERLGDANFDTSQAESMNTTYGWMYSYRWVLRLGAGENASVSYWIEPRSPGNYVITPAAVNISGNGYYMRSASIAVSCSSDGTCAAGSGKNYLNCPQDCRSGSADGVCDMVADSVCDPDCAAGIDSDCAGANASAGSGNAGAGAGNAGTNASKGGTQQAGQGASASGAESGSCVPAIAGFAMLAAAIQIFAGRGKE